MTSTESLDTAFETIVRTPSTPQRVHTGLPQLDRVAPFGPGHLIVLLGSSGVGKTRIARHIAATANCLYGKDGGTGGGSLVVTRPTTIDAFADSLAFHKPALAVVDPLIALLPNRRPAPPLGSHRRLCMAAEPHTADPRELGRLGANLRTLAQRHRMPILACHRYTPIRDSVTGEIVSAEAVRDLIESAHLVGVVRVMADPRMVGVEIIKNQIGSHTLTLSVPIGPEDEPFIPAQRVG